MPRDDDSDLVKRLWQLSLSERMAVLTLSVVQHNRRDTIAAMSGLMAVVMYMSRHLPFPDSMAFGEQLRDMADETERRPELVN